MFVQRRPARVVLASLVFAAGTSCLAEETPKATKTTEQRILVQYRVTFDASTTFADPRVTDPTRPLKSAGSAFHMVLQEDSAGKFTTDVKIDPKSHELFIRGLTSVNIQWHLSKDNEKEIDALLRDVEKKMQNAVLFWVSGEWIERELLPDGYPRIAKFRATSIRLTEYGRRRPHLKSVNASVK